MQRLIVAAFILMTLSGCSSDGSGPSGKFQGADYRFSGTEALLFEQTKTLDLPAGVHTLRISVDAESGFGIGLVSPDGARNGFTHAREAHIGVLEYTTTPGEAGLWTLSYGCDGACEYTVAIDVGNTVRDANVPAARLGGDVFLAGSLSGEAGDDEFTDTLSVSESDVTLVYNMHGTKRMHWSLHDGAGDLVSYWQFDNVTARDWRYQPGRSDMEPGQWRFGIECDAPCEYNVGIA